MLTSRPCRGEEGGRVADERASWKRISKNFINTNFDSWLEKLSRMIGKFPEKIPGNILRYLGQF
jgi:hypothetical protein